ncbi:MAG: DUF4838 domain-containing protein, partial [Lentisphaeria bacterium]|nr:DUF4838 domain-containing protein [Lentisphaeria bacterium]
MNTSVTTIALGAFAAVAAAAPPPRLLVRDGHSVYVIAVPETAEPAVRTAAEELRTYLQRAAGVALPVLLESAVPPQTPRIAVGPCRLVRGFDPETDLASLGPDGILLRTYGPDVVLAGTPPRGTFYAVNAFLEDVVGCRWWTSTEETVPATPVLAVPDLDVAYTPPLRSREAFYRDAFHGPFAARLRLNGHFARIGPEFGGHLPIVGWCHTFFQFLPPDPYFAQHPEWYSEIDGRRTADRTQLCLTNAEMRREFVRVCRERIRSSPGAGLISVSQNDWGGACQCAACRALEEQEGSPSGPLLHFVNAVADELREEFPELLVETLAYHYTRRPPAHVRPRPNVVIRLCSIECSYIQPLATGEQNTAFRSDIEAWSAIAPSLYIWNYVTNFRNYLLPHPNLRVLAPNLRTFVEHHAIGVFEQGDAGCAVGDFVRLRAWVLAHLLWDPSRDENALVDEFLAGYYGPAAPHLRRYLDTLCDAAEQSGVYLRCYLADTEAWLPREALERATTAYAEATAAVAEDPILRERVRRERLPLELVWLQRCSTAGRRIRTAEPLANPFAETPRQAVEAFIALAKQHGAGQYAEGRSFDELAADLRRRYRDPGPPPEACTNLPRDTWIDCQDNLFTLHGYGNWVQTVADDTASDGHAARMPGNHPQWAVQLPLGEELAAEGPWTVHVVLRCEGADA